MTLAHTHAPAHSSHTLDLKPDWTRLERRSLAHRAGFVPVILVFLTVVSIPVLLPYLWLLVRSLTTSDDNLSRLVLWRSGAIVAFAYGGAIAVALLSTRLRNPALLWLAFGAVVAALAFVLVLPHLTIDNYSFLWSRDIEKTGTTRMALMPSVWTAMRSSLLFAASQTLIVALVATPVRLCAVALHLRRA